MILASSEFESQSRRSLALGKGRVYCLSVSDPLPRQDIYRSERPEEEI